MARLERVHSQAAVSLLWEPCGHHDSDPLRTPGHLVETVPTHRFSGTLVPERTPAVRYRSYAYSTSISMKKHPSAAPLILLASREVFPSRIALDGPPASDLRTQGPCRRPASLGGRARREDSQRTKRLRLLCFRVMPKRPRDPQGEARCRRRPHRSPGRCRQRIHFLWGVRQEA